MTDNEKSPSIDLFSPFWKAQYDKILEEHEEFMRRCRDARIRAKAHESSMPSIIVSMAYRYGFIKVDDLWVSAIPEETGQKDENGKSIIKFILPDEVYKLIKKYHSNPSTNDGK